MIEKDSLPATVEVTHINLNDNTVEGLRHKTEPMFCVQYHPESVLTQSGKRQLRNFIRRVSEFRSGGASC